MKILFENSLGKEIFGVSKNFVDSLKEVPMDFKIATIVRSASSKLPIKEDKDRSSFCSFSLLDGKPGVFYFSEEKNLFAIALGRIENFIDGKPDKISNVIHLSDGKQLFKIPFYPVYSTDLIVREVFQDKHLSEIRKSSNFTRNLVKRLASSKDLKEAQGILLRTYADSREKKWIV